MAVENSIGRFIMMVEEHILAPERKIPRMLVEIEASFSFSEELDIVCEGGSFI